MPGATPSRAGVPLVLRESNVAGVVVGANAYLKKNDSYLRFLGGGMG